MKSLWKCMAVSKSSLFLISSETVEIIVDGWMFFLVFFSCYSFCIPPSCLEYGALDSILQKVRNQNSMPYFIKGFGYVQEDTADFAPVIKRLMYFESYRRKLINTRSSRFETCLVSADQGVVVFQILSVSLFMSWDEILQFPNELEYFSC